MAIIGNIYDIPDWLLPNITTFSPLWIFTLIWFIENFYSLSNLIETFYKTIELSSGQSIGLSGLVYASSDYKSIISRDFFTLNLIPDYIVTSYLITLASNPLNFIE